MNMNASCDCKYMGCVCACMSCCLLYAQVQCVMIHIGLNMCKQCDLY